MIAAAALALLLTKQAIAAEMFIRNADELADFTYNVYRGTRYSGTTVFLDADIDFSELSSSKTFYQIGRDNDVFQGVFDGQGYTISNLNIKNNIKYAGLFGYSKGTTIKNVVLDSNCSIESTYTSDSVYVGGILGRCISNIAKCIVENCVNMGTVSYNQRISSSSYTSYIGGIAGYFSTDSYGLSITNCANYGDVKRTNTYYYTYIGGIAGYFYDSYSYYYSSIANCLNSGAISVTGSYYSSSSSELYIGGIVGYSRCDGISNCLSVGGIYTYSLPDDYKIGSIVGYAYDSSSSVLNHCLWTDATYVESGIGSSYSYLDTIDCYKINEVNETTIKDMNYITRGEVWVLNNNGNSVRLNVPGRKTIEFNTNVALLPSPFTNVIGFYNVWYTDRSCKTPLFFGSITQPDLYGKFEYVEYTITFVFSDDYNVTETKHYGEPIEYPTSSPIPPPQEHYCIVRWTPSYKTMPSEDIVVDAVWGPETFYVTFDLNYDVDPIVYKYEFNEAIYYPTPTRAGYEFVEWDKGVVNMPAENITITARWKIIYYTATFIDEGKNESKTYFYENTIKFPTPVGKEGYSFDHWSPERRTMPARNVTFEAVYKKNVYTAFFVDGDEDTEDIELEFVYNETVVHPADPTRTGYEFVKWVSDSGVNITYMPARNVTFTAEWTHIQYVITFFEEDEQTVIDAQKLYYDDAVIYPEVTTKGTRKFYSWDYKLTNMPAGDINVTVIRKDVPTAQVKMQVQGEKDADELRETIELYTDKGFAVKDAKSGSGVTTATIIFDDKVLAEMFVDKIVDKFGSGSGAEIVCEYHYYEGYDDNTRRNSYHASGAGGLVVSAMSFVLVFLLGF